MFSVPTKLVLYVTNRCNLNCSYCMNRHVRDNSPEYLNIPYAMIQINRYLKDCEKYNYNSDIYLGGCESTIHPEFDKLVHLINKKNPDSFILTTNGRLKTELYDLFTEVHISNHMNNIVEEKERIDFFLRKNKNVSFNYVYLDNDTYIEEMYNYIPHPYKVRVFENVFEKKNKEYLEKYNNLITKLNLKRNSDVKPTKKVVTLQNSSIYENHNDRY